MAPRKVYTANLERLRSLRTRNPQVAVIRTAASAAPVPPATVTYSNTVAIANAALDLLANATTPPAADTESEHDRLSEATDNKRENPEAETSNENRSANNAANPNQESGSPTERDPSEPMPSIEPIEPIQPIELPQLIFSRTPGPYPKPQEVRYAVTAETVYTGLGISNVEFVVPSPKRRKKSLTANDFHLKRYLEAVKRHKLGTYEEENPPLEPVSPIQLWKRAREDKEKATPSPDTILFDPETVLISGKLAKEDLTHEALLKNPKTRRGKNGFSKRQQRTFEKRQVEFMEAQRNGEKQSREAGPLRVEIPPLVFVSGYSPGRRTRRTSQQDAQDDPEADNTHHYIEHDNISDDDSDQHPSGTPVPSTPSSVGAVQHGGRNGWRHKEYGMPAAGPGFPKQSAMHSPLSPPFRRSLPKKPIDIQLEDRDKHWKASFQRDMRHELGHDLEYQDPSRADYPHDDRRIKSPPLEGPESPIKACDSEETERRKKQLLNTMNTKRRELNEEYFERKWQYLKNGLVTKAMIRNFEFKINALKDDMARNSSALGGESPQEKALRESRYRVAETDFSLLRLRHRKNKAKRVQNTLEWESWLESYGTAAEEELHELFKKLGVTPKAKFDAGAFGSIIDLGGTLQGRSLNRIRDQMVYRTVPLVAKVGLRSGIERERRFLERFRPDKHPNIVEIFSEYEPEGNLLTDRFSAILLQKARRSSMSDFLYNYNIQSPHEYVYSTTNRTMGNIVPEHIYWDLLHDTASGVAYLHFGVREIYSVDRKEYDTALVSQRLWSPILHGDLKEDNILIDWDENEERFKAVLADFGGVHYHFSDYYDGTGEEYVANDTLLGVTDDYMPPEYPRVSLYWDVWSLGVTFHNALTNHMPRHGYNPKNRTKTKYKAVAICPIHGDPEEWSRFEEQHHTPWQSGSHDKIVADIQRSKALSYHIHRLLGVAYSDVSKHLPEVEQIPAIAYRPHILLALEEIKEDRKKILALLNPAEGEIQHEVPDDPEEFANYVNEFMTHRDADLDTMATFHTSEVRIYWGEQEFKEHENNFDSVFAHVLGGIARNDEITSSSRKRKVGEIWAEPKNDLKTMLDRKTQANAVQFVKSLIKTVLRSRRPIVEVQTYNDLINSVKEMPNMWMSTKLACLDEIKSEAGLNEAVSDYDPDGEPPTALIP